MAVDEKTKKEIRRKAASGEKMSNPTPEKQKIYDAAKKSASSSSSSNSSSNSNSSSKSSSKSSSSGYKITTDANGNIFKDNRYLNVNDPAVRKALENDPQGVAALQQSRNIKQGKTAGAVPTGLSTEKMPIEKMPIEKMPIENIPLPPYMQEFVAQNPELQGLDLADLYDLTYDENVIRDKFDQATKTEYAAKRKEHAITEKDFYNKLAGTQSTALDTIRRSNASAVATGASRGMQAANELSAALGLAQEGALGATELAQAKNLLVDKELAAYSQNAEQALQTSNQLKQGTGNLDANVYGVDTQGNIGLMDMLARADQAAKGLIGAALQANAQKYMADQNLAGNTYTADQNLQGNMYNADKNYAGTIYNSNQNLAGQRIIAGSQGAANNSQAAYYQWLMSPQNPANKTAQGDGVESMLGDKAYYIATLTRSGIPYNDAVKMYDKKMENYTNALPAQGSSAQSKNLVNGQLSGSTVKQNQGLTTPRRYWSD